VNNYVLRKSTKRTIANYHLTHTFSKQGIYDLAGNVYEWTLEYTSSSKLPCAKRGGNYYDDGASRPAAYRDDYRTTIHTNNVGFRLSLY